MPTDRARVLADEEREQIDNEALRLLCAGLRNTVRQQRLLLDRLRLEVDMLLMAKGEQPKYGQTKAEWLAGRNDER